MPEVAGFFLGFGFFLETSSQVPKESDTVSLGGSTLSKVGDSNMLGGEEELALGSWLEQVPCSWLAGFGCSLMV